MSIHIVNGNDRILSSREDIKTFCEKYSKVVLDIGAGDGKGSLRYARKNDDVGVIAIDSSFDALTKTSKASNKKPARGGANNLLCLYGNVRDAANVLKDSADLTRIYLPWGDLLEAIALVDSDILSPVVDCAKDNSEIDIVVNAEIWKSNLPNDLAHIDEVTPEFFLERKEQYLDLGIEIFESRLLDLEEIKKLDTTWSAKLMSTRTMADFVMAKGAVKKTRL